MSMSQRPVKLGRKLGQNCKNGFTRKKQLSIHNFATSPCIPFLKLTVRMSELKNHRQLSEEAILEQAEPGKDRPFSVVLGVLRNEI